MDKLAINDLTFSYTKDSDPVLDNLNLTIKNNTFNLLFGSSGSGKSTLMQIITGLVRTNLPNLGSGTILINGQSIETWTPKQFVQEVALLFQNPREQFSMSSVEDEFVFTLENIGMLPSKIDSSIRSALERVKMLDFRNRDIDGLSGGELQKISLAITLAMDSNFIILDEPFANVDSSSRKELILLLKELQIQDGKTILIADHDLSGYDHVYDNIFHLYHHQIAALPHPEKTLAYFQSDKDEFHFQIPAENQPGVLHFADFSLDAGSKVLLDQIRLEIPTGYRILLTGDNGTGKSTLFNAISHLHPYKGVLTYKNKEVQKYKTTKLSKEVSLIFQDAQIQFLKMTVSEEIELSLKHARFSEIWSPEFITKNLSLLNLIGFENHIVYQLSGGQKKKLQILEMLMLGNPLVLMDEPLAGLDIESVIQVLDMLKKVCELQKQSLIMISHQLVGTKNFFNYHLELKDKNLYFSERLDDGLFD